MSKDQKAVCLNCRWWDGLDISGNPCSYGACRIKAPAMDRECEAVWPCTRKQDWCGEFTARDLPPEDKAFLEAMSWPNPLQGECKGSLEIGKEGSVSTFTSLGTAATRVLTDLSDKLK